MKVSGDLYKLILKSPSTMDNVVVYNLSGQQILTEPLNSNHGNIDIESLATGVYIAQLSIQGEVKSFKFVR